MCNGSIEKWTETKRRSLNLDKTWEMVVSGKSTNPLPEPIAGIERNTWLKLLHGNYTAEWSVLLGSSS